MSNNSFNVNTGHAHLHGHLRSARPLKSSVARSALWNHLGSLLPGAYAGIHFASDFRGQFGSLGWGFAAAHEGRGTAFRGAFAMTSIPVTLRPAFSLKDMWQTRFLPVKQAASWRFVKQERERQW